MGLAKGVMAALKGQDYSAYMDVSRPAFAPSFIAVALTLGVFVFCGYSASRLSEASPEQPAMALLIILGLALLSFPVVAYCIAQLMSRMDLFRPWVIVRNWAFLGAALSMAVFMGLALIGLLPVSAAITLTMLAYVSTLLIDIRLGQTVAGMSWTTAIMSGCVITFASLVVLMAGFASLAGY